MNVYFHNLHVHVCSLLVIVHTYTYITYMIFVHLLVAGVVHEMMPREYQR